MIKISLTSAEMMTAGFHGCMRSCWAYKFNHKDKFIADPEMQWDMKIEACGAELAVSKYTGLIWHSYAKEPDTLPGDVGHLQVRHTHHRNGCLILYEKDSLDAPFILVTGKLPNLYIHGWIYGSEGKVDKYYRTEDVKLPAHFVLQSALHPPETWPREPLVAL